MCEGTSVKPIKCWKFEGYLQNESPDFESDKAEYFEFAVAILKDKPVFVGDKIWAKIGCGMVTVTNTISNPGYYSWYPPNKTFMLNGDELPCPIKNSERTYGFTLGDRRVHFFDSKDECNTVLDAIDKLLLDNTN